MMMTIMMIKLLPKMITWVLIVNYRVQDVRDRTYITIIPLAVTQRHATQICIGDHERG